jgi:hypothetical protein
VEKCADGRLIWISLRELGILPPTTVLREGLGADQISAAASLALATHSILETH